MSDRYSIDSHKLIYHPARVADALEAGAHWEKARSVYPIYVEISPVGACNHRCVFCAVDFVGYKSNRLNLAIMLERLPEMSRLGVRSVCFAGEGEPLLHTGISSMINAAKASGIDVALVTNASVLPRDFIELALPSLSWIKVSINAGSAPTYAAIHQTNANSFDKVIDNMKAMVRAKRAGGLACTMGAQTLLLPDNFGEIELLADICRAIGMDYLVVKPYSQHLSSHTRRYASVDYSGFMALGDRLKGFNTPDFSVIFREKTMRRYLEGQTYDRCYSVPFLWAYIMASGVVSGCSAFLLDQRFEYGNINEATFEAIWTGKKREEGLRFISEQLDISNCRRGCRMDDANRYLHAIHTEQPDGMNFLSWP